MAYAGLEEEVARKDVKIIKLTNMVMIQHETIGLASDNITIMRDKIDKIEATAALRV